MSDWADGFDLGGDQIDWGSIIGNQPENGSFIGAGGTDANGLTPQDYAELWGQAGQGLNQDGSYNFGSDQGGSSPLSALARLFGGGGSGGGGDLSGLLSLLGLGGAVYGGINQGNAARQGGERIQQAANDANTQANSLLGGAMGAFKPYQDAGAGALAKLQAMPQSNLAANFRPVGSGAGLSLASLGKR